MSAYTRAGRLAAALFVLSLAACGDDPSAPGAAPAPRPALLAYSHKAHDSVARIAVMNPDGTGFRIVTTGGTSSWAPSWTRDGEGLVFMSMRQERARLHSVPLAGGEGTLIPTGELHAYQGEWSPDGSTLAVATAGGILLVTDGIARELDTPELPGDPRWSPDGTRLAFTELAPVEGQPGLMRRALFVARPDGTDIRQVATNVPSAIHDPAWSPDGTRLVFEASGVGGAGDLYVVTLATGAVAPLTQTPEGERTPDWSPDGARIAFTRALYPGDRHVWTMKADGSDARQLTTVAGEHTAPRWRPAR